MTTQVLKKELTSKDSDLSKFNHNLTLLLLQLKKAYPDDRDLKIYSDKFDWSKRFDARVACEKFIGMVSPFIKEIMIEDEHFFLNNLDATQHTENEQYLNLVQKIIDIWIISENQRLKKNIWRYFQILVAYGIKALRRRDLAERLNPYRDEPLIIN